VKITGLEREAVERSRKDLEDLGLKKTKTPLDL
jgi:hypothetical protein